MDSGLTWRMMRVEAYLSSNKDKENLSTAKIGETIEMNYKKSKDKTFDDDEEEDDIEDCLIPYNDEYTDRGVDKVIRVAECSLQVVFFQLYLYTDVYMYSIFLYIHMHVCT